MVKEIESKEEFAEAIKYDGLVVIDFFATWCGPCKYIAPILDDIAKENPTVKFIKVDVDKFGDIAKEYVITAMPTFIYLKESKEVHRIRGADERQIREKVAEYK